MEKGRPAKFNTVEELDKMIDDYFENHQVKIIGYAKNTGVPIYQHNPPTLTGLALHLGFVSRQSIYDYEKRNDDFSYSIKNARLRCEEYLEHRLLTGDCHPGGFIFALKNYGWKDTVENNLNFKSSNIKSLLENMSDDDLSSLDE